MNISATELKKIRKVYRLTLEQMAELLGISAGHLSHVENGHYRLTEKVKARLIDQFQLTPDKLARINAVYDEFSLPRKGGASDRQS